MADQSEQIDFIWQGIDKNRKKSGGVIPAKNELIAKTELRRQGYLVTKIKKKPIPFFSARMKAITPNDIAIFSRQLATMLAAGIPLVQSFDIIGKGHENPSMQILLLAIKANIENGDSLAEALKKILSILMNCSVTWFTQANMREYWIRFWIKSRLIKKKPSP